MEYVRAITAARSNRDQFRVLKGAAVWLLASIALAACSGGAETTENPVTSITNAGTAPYSGPVAGDSDVLKFQQEFWSKAKSPDRCGSCHNESVGQLPMFVRNDDVNLAYDAALTVVDVQEPSASLIVAKVFNQGNGHNCWVADPGVCATIMTTWIENWVGSSADGGREIILVAPVSSDPGASKSFPATADSFAALIHGPILEPYCSDCHSSESASPVQPYHSDPNIDSAYDAAKPKINLDAPANSRLVIRLRSEGHFCWDIDGDGGVDCSQAAQIMEDAITEFANFDPTPVDPNLVTSKALRLIDGTLASGGNRYEDAQIALWEFKTGNGRVAYDSSGVDPAIDLNLSQEVSWYGGWGITMNGGRAQGTTTASRKLHEVLQESGEFSIEAWVIPANVTQETARIVSYSANDDNRNFTLQQNLYDYDFRLRMDTTDLNGNPALSTPAMDEVLQATLQHVVATYHPTDGRRIYVNGQLVSNSDPTPGGTFIDWQDTFALVLGSEVGGSGAWEGTVRLAAIHRRAMTQQQAQQNFDVGVGEKFFLLFDISENIAAAAQSSFILFEAQQYDSYSYLFDKPHFITLDGSTPSGIPIEGLRIAMNGLEAAVGQTYATLIGTLDTAEFAELGQPLSLLGAVLPLEKGPEYDEFFLTFDRLHTAFFSRDPDPTLVVAANDLPPASRIGLKTFDEIDATFAAVTGIERVNFPGIDITFLELRQSLPAVEDINTFLASHQVAIAQLAIEYCNALVGDNGAPNPDAASFFPGFNFDAPAGTAFAVGNRDLFVDPLINNIMGVGIASQPSYALVYEELASHLSSGSGRPDNLTERLLAGGSDTRAISKGLCAALLGSAVTLIQ
jgi:hypothetical protein